ncbi:MAG: DedA family protein [Clostridiales bacterium]|jgi:membrane protein DedA with SNARE-associated domain|nr:DedA family protein [Clostridiales bacterium]
MESSILPFAESIANTNPLLAYIFFFLNSVIQVLFPPYPGDSVVIFEGYLSSRGLLNTPLLFLLTYAGTFLSSVFLYILSQRLGEKLVETKFIKKYFDTKKIYKLENWFNKYGGIAILINRFIPGLGSLTLIGAGLFKLKPISAIISISISSLLHNILLFMAGRLTGDNMLLLQQFVGEYKKLILSGILLISGIYIYLKYIHIKNEQD